jgi:HlyD family secretion protein
MTISDLSVFEVEVEVDETEINKVQLAQSVEIEVDAFPDTTFKGEIVEIGNTAIMKAMGTEDQSTNFNVKVVFQDTDVKIRPGMSATVDITTASREDALAVPFAAVVMRAIDLDSLEAARASEGDPDEGPASTLQAAETVADTTLAADTADTAGTADSADSAGEKSADEVEREELKGVFVIREGKARFIRIETGIADQKNIEVTSGLESGDSVVSGPYRVLRNIKDGDLVEVEKQPDEGKS